MKAPIVLADEIYRRLVDDLVHARDEIRVMDLIGGVANVWPESALDGPDHQHRDHQIAVAPDLGDRVLRATAPNELPAKPTEAFGNTPLAWPQARPSSVKRGTINPPWRTPG